MIPARFDERYDPEPDYDRTDVAWDARQSTRRRSREYLLELVPEGLREDFGLDVDDGAELTLF